MSVFRLANQLDEQVEAHLNRLRRNGWLTFKGAEAIELLRKVVHLKQQPILIAHCHRQLGSGPHDYEYFIPSSIGIFPRERLVRVGGTIGPNGAPQTLFWHPEKSCDSSGTFVSGISTLRQYFPLDEIASVELPPLAL
jgi:hypothetical protein